MRRIPTVRIEAPNNPAAFVLINARDFDPAVHRRWVEGAVVQAPAPPVPVSPLEPEVDPVDELLQQPAAEVVAAVDLLTDREVLTGALDREKAQKGRKTVLSALDGRLAALAGEAG